MKVKLLKRLRKKYKGKLSPLGRTALRYKRIVINEFIKEHIDKYRLWFKLLTTITHKKE